MSISYTKEPASDSLLTKLVGNTPIRKCDYLSDRFDTNVFVKEEFHSLGMSSKDRPALLMINDAIKTGKIPPNGTIVEASSGNTGYSMALLAKHFGYSCKIFVSKSTSSEKINLLLEAGAKVEVCDNSNGIKDTRSTQYRAQQYADEHPEAYFTNQYKNPLNLLAHYQTTGPEIWEQTHQQITHFIAGVGTGGTISGTGKFLKEMNRGIHIWGVEPNGSALSDYLIDGTIPLHAAPFDGIEGIGRNFIPDSFDPNYVDNIFQVGLEETVAAARTYRERTGMLTGFSSAAVLTAFQKHFSEMDLTREHTVVLFFPDHGSRYLSKLYFD